MAEMMTDAEHGAFMAGFNLARPPGREELDALDVAEEFAPAPSETVRVAVSNPLAKTFLAELNTLPEELAGAVWVDFLRGMIAQAGCAPVHVHDIGRV